MAADISFASFNLYNFQKAGLTTYSDTPVSTSEYNSKKDWTRNMLIKLNADVVALQELWHKDCLDDVLNTPELSNYKPIYIKPSWYNIAVAMIVRTPWVLSGDPEIIKDFPFDELVKFDDNDGEDDEIVVSVKRFSRSVIKARLKNSISNDTPEITVLCCHLKSKLPARVKNIDSAYIPAVGSAISTLRRTAEATALRMILTDHMKGSHTPTVLIGDLNDDPLSNTLGLVTEQPTISKSSRGRDKSLYNTLHFQQLNSFNDVYYTHEFNKHKGVIDHILVSEEFFEYSKDSIWSHHHTRIFNDHIEDDDPATSDHGVIVSSFK